VGWPGTWAWVDASVVVRVSLVGILAEYAGAPELEIDLPEGACLTDLHRAVGLHPGARFPAEVWDAASGCFTACVRTFVNDEDADDLSRLLERGSRVLLLTMIAGGWRGFKAPHVEKKPSVPPGQKLTDKFPVLHLGPVPSIPPDSWTFTVEGEVEVPLRTTWAQLQALDQVSQASDFHCVTGWSHLGDVWGGVRVRTLLAPARPRPAARYCLFMAEGGYTTDLTLTEASADDVLLAIKLNGAPLSAEHGGPVRLLVPTKYAYKSAKWVLGVVLLADKRLGYWESRGYSSSADPWKEERHSR